MENKKIKRTGNYGHKKAGRKTVEDKKIPVQVYVKGSVIDAVGGIETARVIAKTAIEDRAIKKTKK